MSIERALHNEAEAAAALVANLGDILRDDEDATRDAIEGQTGLMEAIDFAAMRLIEIEGYEAAIAKAVRDLNARKARFERQADNIRSAMLSAMTMAGLVKAERPMATVSIAKTAPKAIVTNEADIPSKFWEPQPPKLDKAELLRALKDKENVPGATLSNGGETLKLKVA